MRLRVSRIPHPPGSRIFLIQQWALRSIGFAAATVLGVLDYLDRMQTNSGQFVCSRARLIADLEGLLGKNRVDEALALLTELGWVERHEETILGPRNLQTRHQYALCAEAIASYLSCDTADVVETEDQDSRERSRPVSRNRDPNRIRADIDQEAESSVEPAAAFKTYLVRESGIACWYESDQKKAGQIELQHPPERIAAAVTSLSTKGKEAVPGLVLREIERQIRDQRTSARQHEASLKYAALLSDGSAATGDEAVRVRGEEFQKRIRAKRQFRAGYGRHGQPEDSSC